jgi:hypothetical protein
MADNIGVRPSTTTGSVSVATDDIGGVHYPVYKNGFGPDGSYSGVTQTLPLPSDSIMVNVARGLVSGAQPFGSYGKRIASGAESNVILWPNGTFSIPSSSGVQMSLVSTNAADDETGANIRTIEIHYLDINLAQQSEILTLQGLTPVTTTATDIRFINCMHVHTFGTSAYAAGNITASNGGTTYSEIATGQLRCSSSARMIPAGYKCYVAGAVAGAVSGTASAGVVIQLVASELDANQYVDPLIMFPQGGIGLQDATAAFNFPVPYSFSAGTVIALNITTDKAAIIAGSWYGWIEPV